ncbi:hypothetical protein [Borrelia sp. HM]|uniref:hypothetical protein n=1 Tax=Borrelia sp. HM TaxID=1882662 RepID=UPI001C763F9D|nr:hypothetical protein [Borrelia sp. HM]BCR21648.1 hypothetical protein BKFM_00213 [Borrelia sp. HM]
MLRDLNINKIFFYLIFFIAFFSCEMSYPDLREVDYVLNYYFTKNKSDYFMTFDLAVRVLNSKDISKFVFENINSKEFIEITKDKYVSYFVDSVLGKDILYCRDLRFNVGDKTFQAFEAKVHLFDFGMRVYSKDIIINLSLSEEELFLVHDYVYKLKDMVKLKEISGNKVYLIKTPEGEIDFLYSVVKIEDLGNVQVSGGDFDTYLGFYFIGKNSNLFFKLN